MNIVKPEDIKKIIFMLKDEVTKYINSKDMLGQKKNDNDIIDDIIKSKLKEMYSYYTFFTKENGHYNIDPTIPTWILSPVSVTLNSTQKFKHKAISLALVYENDSLFGVVYIPYSDELFYAVKGNGAFLNGNKIKVSDTVSDSIKESIQTPTPECSAAMHICHVASGKSDFYFRDNVRPWDYAAATCILEEAGGKITTSDNCTITYYKKANILATNSKIHQMVCDFIN